MGEAGFRSLSGDVFPQTQWGKGDKQDTTSTMTIRFH